jgi:hypothetical protein
MKFTDETLAAYADGELDVALRADIEAEMATDPEIARAIDRHRALAATLRGAYDRVLAEPVPARLASLVAAPAPVAKLEARTAARPPKLRPAAWYAMAASVVAAVLVGLLLARGPAEPYEETPGGLVARGALEEGLETQLASAPGGGAVRIGTSFRRHDGAYCRTFTYGGQVAGLACRGGDDWKIDALARVAPDDGEVRTAASMPAEVLRAVDAAIAGEPLDAAAESAARDAGWRNPQNMAE